MLLKMQADRDTRQQGGDEPSYWAFAEVNSVKTVRLCDLWINRTGSHNACVLSSYKSHLRDYTG